LFIKSRNSKSPHYIEFNPALSNKRSKKFYGDFLTLKARRKNDYLQNQQQSHEPYDHMAGRKQQPHFYQNDHRDKDDREHSYLNSHSTLKLDDGNNIIHSKFFYQPQLSNENSGNEYVISNKIKKHKVVSTSPNSNNIVSPPNQFNKKSINNINRFIKLSLIKEIFFCVNNVKRDV
jgi:hypothetical protein